MHRLSLLITLFFFAACETHSNAKELELTGFDWKHKKLVYLQASLNEISGLAYDSAHNAFLAINDEEGILYMLNKGDYAIRHALKFGKKGDYECVAQAGKTTFVLRSDGDLWSMEFNADSAINIHKYKYDGPETEFEASLWYKQQLLLISKKSDLDKEEQATHIYAFDPVSGQYNTATQYKISWDAIRKKGVSMKSFHPSAAAIQPATGSIFILASIEKLLLICNSKWEPISVHQLDPQMFRQPESITFDEKGNLLIANEADGGRPTLLFIPVKH